MTIQVRQIDFFRLPMKTRFPFRYGIASMTQLPHLVVRATVETDGKTGIGVSADGLAPKWFTKNPATRFEEDDLPEMLRVIRGAAETAIGLQRQPNLFTWWWQLYQSQQAWARENDLAPLLTGFGVSLIERAVLDAVERAHSRPLFEALRSNTLGIDFGIVDDSLRGLAPRDVLPKSPCKSVHLRHTVGLDDPLTVDDIDPASDPGDGLPYSLVENIEAYGLRYFKIKLRGELQVDRDRIERLAGVLTQYAGDDVRLTLDGNEQYRDVETFRDAWRQLRESSSVRTLFDRGLLFVEQPLHRDHALVPSVREGLGNWEEAPPIIIDESDAALESLPTAFALGYAGTSHKNCKGVFKGLIGAARISQQRRQQPDAILSAEDLANVGPIALLQDLAVVAALGIEHVERNGHHYFAGLSMYSDVTQQEVIGDHGDLFVRGDGGFATLSPSEGRLSLGSVNASPFGLARIPDLTQFQPWLF